MSADHSRDRQLASTITKDDEVSAWTETDVTIIQVLKPQLGWRPRKDKKEGTTRQIFWKYNNLILIQLIPSFNAKTTQQPNTLRIQQACKQQEHWISKSPSTVNWVKLKSATLKETESSLEGTITKTPSASIRQTPTVMQFERRIITAISQYQSIFTFKKGG